jgi:hypothetical protein
VQSTSGRPWERWYLTSFLFFFSGATVDIAIWSTVEQGLAITAGSLATTRPLLRLVSAKMGHGYSSTAGPSNDSGYQPQAEPNNKELGKDIYTLSHIVKGSKNYWHKRDSDEEEIDMGKYGVQTSVSVGKTRLATKHTQFSSSQEELRGEGSSGGEGVENSAVVARSFLITSEKA